MTRRFISLSMVGLMFVLLVGTAVAEQDGGKATVQLEQPIKDFETVAKGESLRHDFAIRNTGTVPLEITDVRPACGCTVARYDKTIAPGGVGYIKAEVDTADFNGPIAKTIAVFTSDQANPKLQLVMKADVKPYIGVSPGYARFNYVQGEPVGIIGQTIWAADGSDLEAVDVKVPFDYLKVTQRQPIDEERNADTDGKQVRIDIKLIADAPVGALRDYVEVTVNHPKQKLVKIPISGFVRPRQHVTPEKLDLGKLESASLPLQRTLVFTNFITDGIDLTKVETGNEALTAEINKVDDTGHRFQVVLTVGPEMKKGNLNGTIRIQTTDSKNPVVEVPFSGTIL